MSKFYPIRLELIFNKDGTATLVNKFYKDQGFEIIFDEAMVNCLKNKQLTDYYFVMDYEGTWEIRYFTEETGIVTTNFSFLTGTLIKEEKKVICGNPKPYHNSILT